MTPPIALQLYSVRESLAQDFEATVRTVAGFGYSGVEPAGFPGTTPQAAAELFRSLGLQVPSAHTPLPLGEHQAEVLAAMEALACPCIISGLRPDDFHTIEQVQRSCETFNRAQAVAQAHGMTFGIHNHWWEYQKLGERYVYQILLDSLDPAIFFELDTYWIQTAGVDPAEVTAALGERAPFLHLKDGPCEIGKPQTALGEGLMNIPEVVRAGGDATQWLVVELDACATDMLTAVQKSIQYLTTEELGHGR